VDELLLLLLLLLLLWCSEPLQLQRVSQAQLQHLTGCGELRQNWMLLMVTVHLAFQPSVARTATPLLLPVVVTTVGMMPEIDAWLALGSIFNQFEITMPFQSG
jgi:hypothetical protein